ncbi:MAG: hypothetical protein Q7T74_00235 [Candidatus Saccharibacteria bacterium]|nr:hypothetical protein [Candidatus Saccharibacteria bacterium]
MLRKDAIVEGSKALRRAVLSSLITLVVSSMSVTIAFQFKLTPSMVAGDSSILSVATKHPSIDSEEEIMQLKFTTNQRSKTLRLFKHVNVLQLLRKDAIVEGSKALRRAVLSSLITLVVSSMSVTIAFQFKRITRYITPVSGQRGLR